MVLFDYSVEPSISGGALLEEWDGPIIRLIRAEGVRGNAAARYVFLALGRPVSRSGGHSDLEAALEIRDRSLGRRGGVSGTLDRVPVAFPRVRPLRSCSDDPVTVCWSRSGASPVRSSGGAMRSSRSTATGFSRSPSAATLPEFHQRSCRDEPRLFLYGADHMNSSVNSVLCRRVCVSWLGAKRARVCCRLDTIDCRYEAEGEKPRGIVR